MQSNELLEFAKRAAIAASVQIKRHYKSSFEVSFKDDRSPLTSADLAANEAIFEILSKSGVSICSEEQILNDEIRTNTDTFWLVDPLDGTREFIDKNDQFCVCIALIQNGSPTLGVIMIPMSNELFFASDDGSFVQILDENGKILSQKELKSFTKNAKILYTGTRSKALREQEIATKFDFKLVRIGSSIKFARLAQNGGVYVRFSDSSLWDIAAGEAIVKFSGGVMLGAHNLECINYNSQSLASPKFIAISEQNLVQKDEICKLASELFNVKHKSFK